MQFLERAWILFLLHGCQAWSKVPSQPPKKWFMKTGLARPSVEPSASTHDNTDEDGNNVRDE